MDIIKPSELLGKYVLYNDIYRHKELIIQPKSHVFVVFDKDSDPDTRYCWCIKSIKIKQLELWVKQTQLILLDPNEQESIKMLYG